MSLFLKKCFTHCFRYLITGSTGSKFVKIWKISQGDDLESTEVKELQILRDHSDFLTIIKVTSCCALRRKNNRKKPRMGEMGRVASS